MRLQRRLAIACWVMVVGLSLSACGGSSNVGGDTSTTPAIIEIIENSGTITPDDGHVVKVDVGQQIRLVVSSDVDDEIHVHSQPEHEFEVPAGQDKTFTLTIDIPGTYPVESHGLDVTLVKLQVS